MDTEVKNMVVQSVVANNYPIRTETHQGRQHLVVPVVMMVEGVHSGSRGPLFHSSDELGRVVAAWNGIPITIQHPQTKDGDYISANIPEQVDRAVGRVYNAHMDGDKLKAEAWIDIEKAQAISPEALAYIRQQRPLDVSVGVFTDEEESEGEWNGESYSAIAHNHRPDHLALLPGGRGACSWADGCGIRVNSETMKDFKDLKTLNQQGFAVIPVVNATGFMEVLQKVSAKLDAMDNDLRIYFLEELYEDRVIYRVRDRQNDTSTLYQTTYSVSEDGKVEFTGEPQEVRKNVSYDVLTAGRFRRTKFNNNKTNTAMNKKVEKLIANTECKFTNCDREWLEGLTDNQLDDYLNQYEKSEQPEEVLDVNTAMEFLKENAPKEEERQFKVPQVIE